MATFLSALGAVDLTAQVKLHQAEDADATADLHNFAHGDAESGVGNIMDCYM